MASSDQELAKMIRGFRVSDLQSLLIFAGRNNKGKKPELQRKALDLIGLRVVPINMKIREIHFNRIGQSPVNENPDMYRSLHPVPVAPNYNGRSSHQRLGRTPAMPAYNIPKNTVNAFADESFDQQYQNPDVRFKSMPLYDVLNVLLPPTTFGYSDSQIPFCLTPQQVLELQTSDVLVHVRMCVLDLTSEQEDNIPVHMNLKVNYMVCNLPPAVPPNKLEQKRPKKHIDITSMIKVSANEHNILTINLLQGALPKPHVIACFLVRRVNSPILIRRLKANGVRNPDLTIASIKEKLLDQDCEVATMSLRGSLLCPLGKIKMQLPTRALTCTHLQCFDGNLYIQMNEKKPKWICPICDKEAQFKDLAIDGLFFDIICKAPRDCNEVQFHEDGSWTPVMPVKKQEEVSEINSTPKANNPKAKTEVAVPKKPVEVICLDSDSDTEDSFPLLLPPKKKMYQPPREMSPILLESPEDTQHASESKLKPYNPFLPGTSKQEQSCSKSMPTIPEKSSLAPLPESLDIDSSDVDCILGYPPAESPSIAERSSDFENASPAPEAYHPPKNPFAEREEGVEILPDSSERGFPGFDLFSLLSSQMQQNQVPPAAEVEAEPDIINID